MQIIYQNKDERYNSRRAGLVGAHVHLLYMQGESADIQKDNDLKVESLEYETIRKFLADIKKEFGRGDNKMMKVAELKKIEQKSKMIEEFVQEFRRAAKGSRYEERLLVEEFKRDINRVIW